MNQTLYNEKLLCCRLPEQGLEVMCAAGSNSNCQPSEFNSTNITHVCVAGYQNVARKFFAEHGFQHVVLLSADGALEAAPAMGSADIILDLISTGVTLRENNLKELEGARMLESEVCLK